MLIYVDGAMRAARGRDGLGLRPRPALRRRRLRGHPHLRPPHLPARRAPRPPRRVGARDRARPPDGARRAWPTRSPRPCARTARRTATSGSSSRAAPATSGSTRATARSPCVIIIVTDLQLYPAELLRAGIKVITAATRQVSHEAVDPRIKSLNYLKNVLAQIEAARAGAAGGAHAERRGLRRRVQRRTTSSWCAARRC